MYKLIVFDMDGTLLNSQKMISNDSITAIKKAKSLNKQIVLGTGRAVAELREYEEELDDIRYGILESGALIYDFKQKKVLNHKTLPSESVNKIKELVACSDIMVIAMINGQIYLQQSHFDYIYKYKMEDYKALYDRSAILVDDITSLLEKEKDNFEKINLYHHKSEEREESYLKLSHETVTMVKAESTGLEMTAIGVEKGSGLQFLCDYLNIPISESIAVGDADNDESMIRNAGLGIAMGNANKNIENLADFSVNDNDNGGCSQAIYKYLLS
ncbi:Cof-type HAD-IIB family hydrolase [Lactococcus fujiensis]|nr:Cof-type HAD-IIB family hydrolase [Lactococcus fujiensis]